MLGANASLKVSVAGGRQVELNVEGSGLSTFGLTNPRATRENAGGVPDTITEVLDHRTGDFSFTITDNALSRPLFWGTFGQVLSVVYEPEKGVARSRRFTFRGPMSITHTFPRDGAAEYAVSLPVDGDVVESTISGEDVAEDDE